MSDGSGNPPSEHEAQPQPAANEPPVAQPQRADDEPQGATVDPAPKTPRRRWWRFWRRREVQRTRSEGRFSVLTALISALAALAGAGVGGFASYEAAKSQEAAQFRVAQANNTAQADQALITRRQTAYSDYLAATIDLENSEYRFHDAVAEFKPPNVDGVHAAFQRVEDISSKFGHTSSTVRLVDPPEVDRWVIKINSKEKDFLNKVQDLTNAALSGRTVDQRALDQFVVDVSGMTGLMHNFLDAARNDISRLSGH